MFVHQASCIGVQTKNEGVQTKVIVCTWQHALDTLVRIQSISLLRTNCAWLPATHLPTGSYNKRFFCVLFPYTKLHYIIPCRKSVVSSTQLHSYRRASCRVVLLVLHLLVCTSPPMSHYYKKFLPPKNRRCHVRLFTHSVV